MLIGAETARLAQVITRGRRSPAMLNTTSAMYNSPWELVAV
jgi:hypothetical protein